MGLYAMKADGTSNLKIALEYAEAGMAIFPCGPDKRPLLKEWLANASTDEQTIRRWWQAKPEALIGLPLKPLDLVVVDADRHHEDEDGIETLSAICAEHGELPPHPWATTANGGTHHYFKQPAGEKIGNKKIASGLETRGFKPDNDGGFVIASGSQLSDGRRWWRGEGAPSLLDSYRAGTIPTAPSWLLNGIGPKRQPERPRTNGATNGSGNGSSREAAYAQAALDGIATELGKAAPGSRNNDLNGAAYRMGRMVSRGWISRPDVTDALWAASEANGLVRDDGADTVQATLASGLRAGEQEPHPGLENRPHEGFGVRKALKNREKRIFEATMAQVRS